ncbi:MAG TPA: TetR/AcrR family transcriptional regulator [Aeromicrobium sp.]|nr:TetR/AcrR family transcriptional regulator [Aeromicrobium sp.]
MAKVTTPRERWVEAGLSALTVGGPEAVRIESLATSLGVTKGGFYWHFADRRALLDEMLDTWERTMVDDVIASVESAGGDGRARLRDLFLVGQGATPLLPLELAVRDWSRRDPTVLDRLTRVDNRRMEYLRSLFIDFVEDPAEVEARSFLVFCVWIGQPLIAAEHGRRSRRDVVQSALELALR